jgi:hypothetical protein
MLAGLHMNAWARDDANVTVVLRNGLRIKG